MLPGRELELSGPLAAHAPAQEVPTAQGARHARCPGPGLAVCVTLPLLRAALQRGVAASLRSAVALLPLPPLLLLWWLLLLLWLLFLWLVLGALLAFIGALVVFKAAVIQTEGGNKVGPWAWRPLPRSRAVPRPKGWSVLPFRAPRASLSR